LESGSPNKRQNEAPRRQAVGVSKILVKGKKMAKILDGNVEVYVKQLLSDELGSGVNKNNSSSDSMPPGSDNKVSGLRQNTLSEEQQTRDSSAGVANISEGTC
jgi:hypothetical protein